MKEMIEAIRNKKERENNDTTSIFTLTYWHGKSLEGGIFGLKIDDEDEEPLGTSLLTIFENRGII